jgi:hypothetical protein
MPVILSTTASPPPSSTSPYWQDCQNLADLRKRVRILVGDEPFELAANNAGQIGDADTSITVVDGSQFQMGDRIEFADDSDDMAKVTAAPTGNIVPIRRNHNGSTAATHGADVLLLKNPVYEGPTITEALTRTAYGLWPYVYAVAQQTITPVAATVLYELDIEAIDLVSVSQQATGTTVQYHQYGSQGGVGLPVSITRSLPTATFTSGQALYVPSVFNMTNDLTVTYRTKLTTDCIPDGEIADLVAVGAAMRLLSGQTFPRMNANNQQGNRTVSAFTLMQAKIATWRQDYMRLRAACADDLRRLVPPMQLFRR